MDTSKPITVDEILTANDLTGLTTRHLLSLFRKLSISGYYRLRYYDYDECRGLSPQDQAVQRLRAELRTRPHVPNKKEGKRQRQLAAKRKN